MADESDSTSNNENNPSVSKNGTETLSNQPTDPTLNPNSPYYLHPGENPGSVLVSPALNGDNYYHWSRAMQRALYSKNKLKFINGSISAPASSDPLFDSWERCNNLVVSWITRTLSPQISLSSSSSDNARELWLDLHKRFTKGNHFRMSDLLQELHSMRQDDRTLTTFFTDIKILWDELEYLRPTPNCTCLVACTCSLQSSVQTYKDKEHVICFLKGLNDSYQPVHTQILMTNPLPSISEAYSMVVQQKRQPSVPHPVDSSVFTIHTTNFAPQGRGMNSQGRGRGRSSNRPPMLCTYCNHTNHTVDNCYFKHGFPLGYRSKTQNSTSQIATATTEHIPKVDSAVHHTQQHSNDMSMPISKEDYQLVKLFQSSKNDIATSVNSVSKPTTSDPAHHMVSSVTKSD